MKQLKSNKKLIKAKKYIQTVDKTIESEKNVLNIKNVVDSAINVSTSVYEKLMVKGNLVIDSTNFSIISLKDKESSSYPNAFS